MKKIDLIYFDAGGGHRAAALALVEAARRQGLTWDMRLVNLQEVLAPSDIFKRYLGLDTEALYNAMIRRGWTLGTPQLLVALHLLIRACLRRHVSLLSAFWKQSQPDLVVSLVPNFNRAINASVRRALPGIPQVTLMTDLADYPPHFWLESDTPAVICGSEKALRQAQDLGIPRRIAVSGMILHPRFYELAPLCGERRAARLEQLGLRPGVPTGLVLFGGMGSPRIGLVARALERARLPVQLICVCGHNARQEEALRSFAASSRMPIHVVGFSQDIPGLLGLSDFFIGKPGPGSISEAIHLGVPVVVERNLWTLPQERYNAEWIERQQAGLVLRSMKDIAGAVEELLRPGRLQALQAHVRGMQNNAVWEIIAALGELLREN